MASEQAGQGRSEAEVPWSGLEVLLVALLAWLGPYLAFFALYGTGWLGWFYGADVVESGLRGTDDAAVLTRYRLLLWANCLAPPFQVAAALGLLHATSGVRPAQLGLTARRLGGNVLAGLLAVAVLAPGAYGVWALVQLLFEALGVPTVEHPFGRLGKLPLHPAEWALLWLAAVVAAPLWEEFFFRGVLQRWAVSRPEGGPVVMGCALLFAVGVRADHLPAAWAAGPASVLRELAPGLIVLALVPAYLALARRRPTAARLLAVAVLFAFYHTGAWPSPLALLWLGLGLGWLAWRSGSLVGPFVLHALFNAIGCAALVYRALSG